MVQPWRVNLDEQAKRLSCTTDVIADKAVTAPKLADGCISPLHINNPNTFHFSRITLDNGTAVAPSLAFQSALTTGLFYDGSNVSLSIAGIEKFRVGSGISNFFTDLRLNNHQLLAFRVENVIADPAFGNPGRLIWRTDVNQLRVDTGTGWITFGSSSSVAWGNITGSIGAQPDLVAALGAKQDTLLYVPEDVANKSTDIALGGLTSSNTLYPSQLAVKTYVDTAISGFSTSLSGLSDVQLSPLLDGQTLQYDSILGKWKNATLNTAGNHKKEFLVVTNPAVHIITLLHSVITDSEIVSWNGVVLVPGITEDYTVSGNTITLSASINLNIDDQIMVTYSY